MGWIDWCVCVSVCVAKMQSVDHSELDVPRTTRALMLCLRTNTSIDFQPVL